jgi:hypothetical protein
MRGINSAQSFIKNSFNYDLSFIMQLEVKLNVNVVFNHVIHLVFSVLHPTDQQVVDAQDIIILYSS